MSLFFILAFIILMALNPALVPEAAGYCIDICIKNVIPALFPFFILSHLLVNQGGAFWLSKIFAPVMKPLFGLSGNAALPFVIGLLSGYPVGAKTCALLAMKNMLSKKEASNLLAFCNNSGPLFILGVVGAGMLQSPKIGFVLYISQFLAAISTGMFLKDKSLLSERILPMNDDIPKKSFSQNLENAIFSAGKNMLLVCGYIIIFNIFARFLEKYGAYALFENFLTLLGQDPHVAAPLFYGFFEVTVGCRQAAPLLFPLNVMLIAAITSWSGISVHMQVLGAARQASLSVKPYFKGKLIQSFLSPLFTFLIIVFFRIDEAMPVFAPSYKNILFCSAFTAAYIAAGIAIIFAIIFLERFYFLVYTKIRGEKSNIGSRK